MSDQEQQERRERHTYIVAVYDAALGYGGPEEGGWWFDTGSLVRVCKTFSNQERAYAYSRRLNAKLNNREWGPNQGRYEKSSCASDGWYQAEVHEDFAPKGYPERRPHYE